MHIRPTAPRAESNAIRSGSGSIHASIDSTSGVTGSCM